MRKDFKKYLMSLLKLKHSHLDPLTQTPSMKEALKCYDCGGQVAKAEAVYKRRERTHPDEFIYKKPEFIRSQELETHWQMLIDRVKNDKLYKAHLERLNKGTESQQKEEMRKIDEGYYQKHYEEGGIIKQI